MQVRTLAALHCPIPVGHPLGPGRWGRVASDFLVPAAPGGLDVLCLAARLVPLGVPKPGRCRAGEPDIVAGDSDAPYIKRTEFAGTAATDQQIKRPSQSSPLGLFRIWLLHAHFAIQQWVWFFRLGHGHWAPPTPAVLRRVGQPLAAPTPGRPDRLRCTRFGIEKDLWLLQASEHGNAPRHPP